MPSFNCVCGHRINCGEIPNPNEWLFISDTDYDNYTGNINADDLYHKMKHALLCNHCKRLIIFCDEFWVNPIYYLPDNQP